MKERLTFDGEIAVLEAATYGGVVPPTVPVETGVGSNPIHLGLFANKEETSTAPSYLG